MVKCPSCGSENPTHVAFCGTCGESIPTHLRRAEEQGVQVSDPSAQGSGGEQLPMKKCNWCGELNKWSANFCTNCGKDPHAQPTSSDYLSDQVLVESRPRSGLPVAGGILTLVAGILDVAMGLAYLAAGSVALSLGFDTGFTTCCGLLAVFFGVGAFIGGIFAIQRKHFLLALVGGIVGIIGVGFIIGAVLSLIGLVLIAVSRAEFEE